MRSIFYGMAFSMVIFAMARCQYKPDPDVEAGAPEDCSAACENLVQLGCSGAEGSPGEDEVFGTEDDVSCAEVCEDIMQTPPVSLHPGCVAKATSCEEVKICFQ